MKRVVEAAAIVVVVFGGAWLAAVWPTSTSSPLDRVYEGKISIRDVIT